MGWKTPENFVILKHPMKKAHLFVLSVRFLLGDLIPHLGFLGLLFFLIQILFIFKIDSLCICQMEGIVIKI